jgi:outer membrane protein insertion porin family/translocation and assembly module TamA
MRPPLARRTAAAGPLVALAVAGCTSIPRGRSAIDSLEIVGAKAIEPGDVLDKLATAETPKFLGLFRGIVNEYSVYDASVLQRDLARVERYYRGHGFFEAHARVARVEYTSANHVRIQILVDEGPPVVNGSIRIEGLDAVAPVAVGAPVAAGSPVAAESADAAEAPVTAGSPPPQDPVPQATASAARTAAAAALPKGKRFDEAAYGDSVAAVKRALTDRGYAYAAVQTNAQVDLASHTIDYVFVVTPGIRVTYGDLTVQGLDPDGAGPRQPEISEDIVRRVVNLRRGAPFSTVELRSAEQALLDLEVFSAARVTPQLSDPSQPVTPLLVEVEPAKLRTLRVGVGAELDAIKSDVHALLGWEDHNFLGNLRDFSVDFTPGLDFFPTSIKTPVLPTDYLPEEKLRMQLRQPGFLEARTVGFVQPQLNVYPLLVGQESSQSIVGYVEPKGAIGVNRRFGNHLTVTLAYNVQGELPFFYKRDGSPTPPALLLAFPQLTAKLDFTDNPVHPHAGVVFNADAQWAAGPTREWANDLRITPDVEGYIPIVRGVTFALTATLGFLFPYNYGDTVRDHAAIQPAIQPSGNQSNPESAAVNRDIQTIYFRGFFDGGPTSNRGFPVRGVAPHAFVPFLNPATAGAQVAHPECDPKSTVFTPEEASRFCASPVGGFTEWAASAELRFDVSGPLRLAAFCDVGDVSQFVFPDPGAFRFNYLHMSCGGGVRYDTPVGPLRLDIAYRIPWAQIVGFDGEGAAAGHDATFGYQPQLFGVLPVGIAFGIGEAF